MTEKRDLIFEAAVDLFSKDGFWKTSTASIARKAGVANGTLFNCFASKEILIDEIYVGLKRELYNAFFEEMPESDDLKLILNHSWRVLTRWAMAHPTRWRLLDQLRMSELVSSEKQAEVAEDFRFYHDMVEAAVISGTIINMPLKLHMELLTGQVGGLISFFAGTEKSAEERDELVDQAFAAYWKGISTAG